jgi:integrase
MNNPHISIGILAPFVHDFINMRKNLGFKSQSAKYSLISFDAFTRKKGLSSITITRDVAEQWCCRRPDEATDTWSHRNGFLRQFSTYLSNLGYETYIPPKVFSKHDTFIPYIFSDDELDALYNACDSLVLYDKHAKSGMMVLPALIRMLAATGIRIGEATNLLEKDVNLEHNYLTLPSRHKMLLIVLSLILCRPCN